MQIEHFRTVQTVDHSQECGCAGCGCPGIVPGISFKFFVSRVWFGDNSILLICNLPQVAGA